MLKISTRSRSGRDHEKTGDIGYQWQPEKFSVGQIQLLQDELKFQIDYMLAPSSYGVSPENGLTFRDNQLLHWYHVCCATASDGQDHLGLIRHPEALHINRATSVDKLIVKLQRLSRNKGCIY